MPVPHSHLFAFSTAALFATAIGACDLPPQDTSTSAVVTVSEASGDADTRASGEPPDSTGGETGETTTEATGETSEQTPQLALWWFPEADQSFLTRETAAQLPFFFNHSSATVPPYLTAQGLRMRPFEDDDTLRIDTTNDPDSFDWWTPQPASWIWYLDVEFEPDAAVQADGVFVTFLRRSNIDWVGFILLPAPESGTSEIAFRLVRNNVTATVNSGVHVNPVGGRYRMAFAYESDPFGRAYIYVGDAPGLSTKGEDEIFTAPPLDGPLNYNVLRGSSRLSSYRGTAYLKEHRVYTGLQDELFVSDLAAGEIVEGPLP